MAGGAVALKVKIADQRRSFQPLIECLGLLWADVAPVLQDAVLALEIPEQEWDTALANPQQLLDKTAKTGGAVAKQLAIAKLRPRIEPVTKRQGLLWADVAPALAAADTIQKLEKAAADPPHFLDEMIEAGGAVAIKLAIAKLRPGMEQVLAREWLLWTDVVPVLEAVGNVKVLKRAAVNPDSFLDRIAQASEEEPSGLKWEAAKKP
eukprot:2885968-Prymnesium_polylepis.1